MRKAVVPTLVLATFALVSLGAEDAQASGFYYAERGVRPLGRGGAFVAGANDIGAIWYNPSGLAEAGSSFLFDMAWLNFSNRYTRKTQVTDAGGTVRQFDFPQVEGTTPVLPIPTIGGSYAFGDKKQYTVALGALAPYVAVTSYPATVNGQPSPSRYSLLSLDGSALVILGGFFAFKPVDWFRVGAGLQLLTGSFQSTVVFNANPADRLIGAPEDPTWDTTSELKVGPIFAPSANAGMTFVPHKKVAIGLIAQAPFSVNAPATIKTRLPIAAPFDKAYQDGVNARVRFKLPPTLGAGVEVRHELNAETKLKVEATYAREFWSVHDTIDIRAEDVKLIGITGFPSPFGVAPITIPRNFVDANTFALGGELGYKLSKYDVVGRLGVNYSETAVPPDYVSPLGAVDTDKITIAIGGGIFLMEKNKLRLDFVYARVVSADVVVPPDTAKVPRVNPVKGNPTKTEAVNGGLYEISANVFGLGMNYKF